MDFFFFYIHSKFCICPKNLEILCGNVILFMLAYWEENRDKSKILRKSDFYLFTKQLVLFKGLLPAEEKEEKFLLFNLISWVAAVEKIWMLLILKNWKIQKTCRSFCRNWSRRKIEPHLIIWIAFHQVELMWELKMQICCSPLTNDDSIFIIIKTTTAPSFMYFKERSKVKALGDKFVLSSTSIVHVWCFMFRYVLPLCQW